MWSRQEGPTCFAEALSVPYLGLKAALSSPAALYLKVTISQNSNIGNNQEITQ